MNKIIRTNHGSRYIWSLLNYEYVYIAIFIGRLKCKQYLLTVSTQALVCSNSVPRHLMRITDLWPNSSQFISWILDRRTTIKQWIHVADICIFQNCLVTRSSFMTNSLQIVRISWAFGSDIRLLMHIQNVLVLVLMNILLLFPVPSAKSCFRRFEYFALQLSMALIIE